MRNKLEYVIQQILNEQWDSLASSHVFNKNYNANETNCDAETCDTSSPKEIEFRRKLRSLEPTIRQSQQFKQFLEDLGNTNPKDQASLFGMYENFLRYFAIDRDDFQDGDQDDWVAAKAVADYFKYHPERLG